MGLNKSSFLDTEGALPEERVCELAKNPARFWPFIAKIQIEKNKIAAWNFCYTAHRILCSASPTDVCQLEFDKRNIQDLGSIWLFYGKSQYGKLIYRYTTLLASKLKFHEFYPKVNGQFSISNEELAKKIENRAEFFAMVNEILDYRELNLIMQDEILKSYGKLKPDSKRAKCITTPLSIIFKEYRWISNLLQQLCKKWETTSISNYSGRINEHTKRYNENWEKSLQLQIGNLQLYV